MGQLAPTYRRTELAIPPTQTDCYGTRCPVAAREGSCFTSRHHLYYPKRDYTEESNPELGSLPFDFRSNPFNIINMARCAHDTEHRRYDAMPLPQEAIMRRFQDETALLSRLNVVINACYDLEVQLFPDVCQTAPLPVVPRRDNSIHVPKELIKKEDYATHPYEVVIELAARATEAAAVSVLPRPMLVESWKRLSALHIGRHALRCLKTPYGNNKKSLAFV